jgi:hypothetical protein
MRRWTKMARHQNGAKIKTTAMRRIPHINRIVPAA